MMMKAKKDYKRPTMKVVMLRNAGMLMTSDPRGFGAQRSSYTYGRTTSTGDEDVWE